MMSRSTRLWMMKAWQSNPELHRPPCTTLRFVQRMKQNCLKAADDYGCLTTSKSLYISIIMAKSNAIWPQGPSSPDWKKRSKPFKVKLRHGPRPGGSDCSASLDSLVSIATIIVNFNAGELLQQCVSALRKSTIHTSITIVDNASSDGSAENPAQFYMAISPLSSFFSTLQTWVLHRQSMRLRTVRIPTIC